MGTTKAEKFKMAESTNEEQNQLLNNEKLYPNVQQDSEALAADTPPAYTESDKPEDVKGPPPGPGPIVKQPEATAPPPAAATTAPRKEFKQSLFGCGLGEYCYGWCCPCLMGADISQSLGSSYTAGCCMYFCSMQFGLCSLVACLQRGQVRTKYGIEGGAMSDCVASCCCFVCVLAQMKHELEV